MLRIHDLFRISPALLLLLLLGVMFSPTAKGQGTPGTQIPLRPSINPLSTRFNGPVPLRGPHLPQPVQLLGLACSSSVVEAGALVTIHLRLNAPAPAGGYLISLVSSSPKTLRLPRVIVIPAGRDAVGLTVRAGKSSLPGVVTLQAANAADAHARPGAKILYHMTRLKVAPTQQGGKP